MALNSMMQKIRLIIYEEFTNENHRAKNMLEKSVTVLTRNCF